VLGARSIPLYLPDQSILGFAVQAVWTTGLHEKFDDSDIAVEWMTDTDVFYNGLEIPLTALYRERPPQCIWVVLTAPVSLVVVLLVEMFRPI
jgi:hypothetical protein